MGQNPWGWEGPLRLSLTLDSGALPPVPPATPPLLMRPLFPNQASMSGSPSRSAALLLRVCKPTCPAEPPFSYTGRV